MTRKTNQPVSYITNQWVRMNPTEATERIEELEKAFEKLEITAEAGASREAALRSTIAELQRENVALREKVDDWENAVLHARDNRSEEQHCTCVAPLLGKLKQLERENEELHIAVNVARDLIKTLQRDNIKLRAALERLRDCDFVVTPMDRMDAVREIAREALKGVNP